jgi:hypothetical protein
MRKEQGASPLIEAIPIKLYDEEFVDDAERHECVNWIKNNRRLWEPLSMDYIKKVYSPKLLNAGFRPYPQLRAGVLCCEVVSC